MKKCTQTWEQSVLNLRANPSNKDLVEACYFDEPLLAASERYSNSTEWRAVLEYIPSGPGRVLDVGAGRGMVAYALAKAGWDTTALEPDPSPIVGAGAIRALAAEAGLPIKVIETWGENLPFSDCEFDVVICRQVLHHSRDLWAFCREATRVLKPGGTFLGLRDHVIDRRADLPIFLNTHPLHKHYGGENAFLLCEYENALESAGLRIFRCLNPLASDINLFPSSKLQIKARWARKLCLPSPKFIPDFMLILRGSLMRTPGRIYSFIARKANA